MIILDLIYELKNQFPCLCEIIKHWYLNSNETYSLRSWIGFDSNRSNHFSFAAINLAFLYQQSMSIKAFPQAPTF